jgi:hypothetical protein
MVAYTMQIVIVIVTVMVCLIAPIATVMAMVLPIARTAARTTLAATDSKRQQDADVLTEMLSARGSHFHSTESRAPGFATT